MKLSRRVLLADIGTYVAYAVIFLFFAGPLLWLVSLSICNSSEIFVSDLRLLPQNPTMENFASVLHHPLFPLYLWNGLKLAVAGAFGAMLFATPAAYALVAIPLPQPQPDDDRPPRVPDDLAASHHGAALPLHGSGRA